MILLSLLFGFFFFFFDRGCKLIKTIRLIENQTHLSMSCKFRRRDDFLFRVKLLIGLRWSVTKINIFLPLFKIMGGRECPQSNWAHYCHSWETNAKEIQRVRFFGPFSLGITTAMYSSSWDIAGCILLPNYDKSISLLKWLHLNIRLRPTFFSMARRCVIPFED